MILDCWIIVRFKNGDSEYMEDIEYSELGTVIRTLHAVCGDFIKEIEVCKNGK